MGGLFSSEKKKSDKNINNYFPKQQVYPAIRTQTTNYSPTIRPQTTNYPPTIKTQTTNYSHYENTYRYPTYDSLLANKLKQQTILVKTTKSLSKHVKELMSYDYSDLPANVNSNWRYKLDSSDEEYLEIQHHFKRTTQKHFQVQSIEKVYNPYIYGCYLLKKEELESRMNGWVQEEKLFHGTTSNNINLICQNNFNWRKHGEKVGNKFGQGVSFSPISCYASNYSDKNTLLRSMFVVHVSIGAKVCGNPYMELPPIWNGNVRYDTAAGQDNKVIVKFSDNEFYPQYIINYTGYQIKKRNF